MDVTGDFEPREVIPIAAFFAPDLDGSGEISPNPEIDFDEVFGKADLIFGVNIMEHRPFLVYGRALLEEIICNDDTDRDLRILMVGIDQETDELEQLISLVESFKGPHEYEAYKPPQ